LPFLAVLNGNRSLETPALDGPGFGKSFLCSFSALTESRLLKPGVTVSGHSVTIFHRLSGVPISKNLPRSLPLPEKETVPLGFWTNGPFIDRF
jgi:hypothetical protein